MRSAHDRRACRRGRGCGCPGIQDYGEVAERLKAAVLKTARVKALVGSNPTLSAKAAPLLGSHRQSARAAVFPMGQAFLGWGIRA